jgi:hypothetical protein
MRKVVHERDDKCKISAGNHMEGPGVDERIMLIRILKIQGCGLDSSGSG